MFPPFSILGTRCYNPTDMDTITVPRTIIARIEYVLRHVVTKIEPKDTEARNVRSEAADLMQTMTTLSNETTQEASSGADTLLELAKLAETEGWAGPSDLAENHDTYAADAIAADLKRIHDDYR